MTLAASFAIDVPGLSMAAVLADTRISYKDGTYADAAVKTHDLGGRCAAVTAGLSIVGHFAGELTRSMMVMPTDEHEPVLNLWDATRMFAHFAREVHRQFKDVYRFQPKELEELENEFAFAGFYSDGTPGTAYLQLNREREFVEFFRPGREQFGTFTVGAETAKGILSEAAGDFGMRGSHFDDPTMAMASAIMYAARNESKTFGTVGGGVAIGICTSAHDRFVWPTVEVNGERYYRGLRAEFNPNQDPKTVLHVRLDTNRIEVLDRRLEDAKHGRVERLRRPRTFECSVDEIIGEALLQRTSEPPQLCGVVRNRESANNWGARFRRWSSPMLIAQRVRQELSSLMGRRK